MVFASDRTATIAGVIVLHAVWSTESQLCVWGEDSSLPASAPRRRGRKPAKTRPRGHPFACATPQLRKALRGIDVTSAPRTRAGRELTLLLPSFENGPQRSPHLLRADEETDGGVPGGLDPWVLPALAFGPSAAVDMLLALPWEQRGGAAVGDSLTVCRDRRQARARVDCARTAAPGARASRSGLGGVLGAGHVRSGRRGSRALAVSLDAAGPRVRARAVGGRAPAWVGGRAAALRNPGCVRAPVSQRRSAVAGRSAALVPISAAVSRGSVACRADDVGSCCAGRRSGTCGAGRAAGAVAWLR